MASLHKRATGPKHRGSDTCDLLRGVGALNGHHLSPNLGKGGSWWEVGMGYGGVEYFLGGGVLFCKHLLGYLRFPR